MIHNPFSRLASTVPMLALWICCAPIVHCVQLEDASQGNGDATRTWGTAERIHDNGTAPDVAIDPAGNAVTVWTQPDNIWSSRYTPSDGWAAPEIISRGGDPLETAKIAMDPNGNTTAVWSQFFLRGNIFTNRYSSGAWGISHRLDDDSGEAFEPQVSVGADGSAVAVWAQSDGARDDVWAARFAPNSGWGDPARIEDINSVDASRPQVAVDPNGNAVAVWVQFDGTRNRNDVWTNRFTPGNGWNPVAAQRIEANNAGDASSPQVGVDGNGNAIAVWTQSDGVTFDIWANRYTPGNGWNPAAAQRIEANDTGDASDPQVAVDANGNAVAVWVQSDGTRDDIWANRYTRDGVWGDAERIEANDTGDAQEPHVAIDSDGNAVAVWRQFVGTGDSIWSNHCRSTGPWGAEQRIDAAQSGTIPSDPRVAMNPSGTAVAVWRVVGGASTGIWSSRSE